MKPTPKTLVQLMSSLGEKDTIVRYPGLIEALVAEGRDPLASAVNLAELRAAISRLGSGNRCGSNRMSCGDCPYRRC